MMDNDQADRSDRSQDRWWPSFGDVSKALVPTPLVLLGLTVWIDAPTLTIEAGEPLEFTINIRNRLPLPVALTTAEPQLWGWEIGGQYKGKKEPTFPDRTETYAFEALETKRFHQEWAGRFQTTNDGHKTWPQAAPGEYELRAFIYHPNAKRYGLTDAISIRVK
ncbi:MAG: hypothetical protein ABEI86_10010 [Halobacteriaceae archaeon]